MANTSLPETLSQVAWQATYNLGQILVNEAERIGETAESFYNWDAARRALQKRAVQLPLHMRERFLNATSFRQRLYAGETAPTAAMLWLA